MNKLDLPAERYPFFDKLLFGTFVLLLPMVLASSSRIFDDGDVSWHIASGRWILSHGRVPTADPFSFTMAGHPWVAFEWLAEVVYAFGFNLAGYAGVAAIVAAALIGLHWIVFLHLRRRVGPVAILIAFMAMDVALAPFTLARPHVLVWPILAGWTSVLLASRDAERSPPWALALLMFVWANLHGSFVIGFVIAGAAALDALIGARWNRRVLRDWLMFGLLSLAVASLNANGLTGLLHPLTIAGMETLTLIQEWQPSSPFQTPWFFIIVLGVLGGMLIKGAKLRSGELALLLFMLAMAFWQMRHQSWLAIVAVLIVTPSLAGSGRRNAPPLFASLKQARAVTALALAAALLLLAGRLMLPLVPKENGANPRGLIAHIPEALKARPVFNGYTFGGPLILAGVKPYIDGRGDVYGDQFVSGYSDIFDGDIAGFEAAVRKYGIEWTILPNGHVRLVKALDSSAEWRRIYADKVGVIHVRQRGTATTPRR